MIVRHYNTWMQEGDNRFRYKYHNNPLHRLKDAGFHEFGGAETILFTKKEVVEYIGDRHQDHEFVYSAYGSCYKQYLIYAKPLSRK